MFSTNFTKLTNFSKMLLNFTIPNLPSFVSLFSQQFRSLVGHQFTFPAPLEHETRRGRRKSDRGEEEEERRGRRRSMRGEEEQPRSISRLGSLPLAGSNSALSSVLHIHVSLTSDISLLPFSVIIITTSLRCPIPFLFLSLRHKTSPQAKRHKSSLHVTPLHFFSLLCLF